MTSRQRAEDVGSFGGVVLRGFPGRDRQFRAGDTISPEDALNMKMRNRLSLETVGNVQWFRGSRHEPADLGSPSGEPGPQGQQRRRRAS
jgi:hypothetical protein